jgi:polygalacturonase
VRLPLRISHPRTSRRWLTRITPAQQLALEAQSISTRAATLTGAQDSQRTKDGWATAAAVVVFWPAAFLVGGDKQTAAELAQMKGQMVAVEQASIAKKCNIQFQGKPEGSSG